MFVTVNEAACKLLTLSNNKTPIKPDVFIKKFFIFIIIFLTSRIYSRRINIRLVLSNSCFFSKTLIFLYCLIFFVLDSYNSINYVSEIERIIWRSMGSLLKLNEKKRVVCTLSRL